jgi:hypothetical protein
MVGDEHEEKEPLFPAQKIVENYQPSGFFMPSQLKGTCGLEKLSL